MAVLPSVCFYALRLIQWPRRRVALYAACNRSTRVQIQCSQTRGVIAVVADHLLCLSPSTLLHTYRLISVFTSNSFRLY